MVPQANSVHPAHIAGFTLVETLVSISLLGLLSLLAVSVLRIGTGLWTGTERVASTLSSVTAIENVLRQTVERAYPAIVLLPEGGYQVAFHGTEHTLELSGSLPPEIGVGGHRRIRISRDGTGENETVVMVSRLERNLVDLEALPEPEQRLELLTGVRSIDFSYFGTAANAPRAEWRTDWTGQHSLPRLVRIDVTFADGSRRWPTLSVAPRIDVDATCVLDPLTKLCRGR